MNPNKSLWEKGDFTRIAQSMRESGEALVKTLGVTKGLKVLDLGCGDGTTALPEAELGADVLGVDIARNLVEAGNKRAKALGLTNCRFQEGDASNLHELKGQTFDAPEGTVWIDPDTQHTFRRFHVGRFKADGQVDIVHSSKGQIAPTPYPPTRSSRPSTTPPSSSGSPRSPPSPFSE